MHHHSEKFILPDWGIAQFYSKKFENSVIRSCSVINKELLAIILTFERFKQFVVSCSDVQVRTDARSLVFLYYSGNKGGDSKAARWLAKVREMNVTFMHFLPREDNQTANFLSNRFRPPSPQHDHLAKYSFSKAVKSQVKVKLEIGQKFTNEDLEQLVKDSPKGLNQKQKRSHKKFSTRKAHFLVNPVHKTDMMFKWSQTKSQYSVVCV
jgi:hypothetical protein